jgi:hypothetical protein
VGVVEMTGDADEYVEIDPETDALVPASAEDLQLLASKTGVLESGEPSIGGGDGSLVKESEQ